MSEKDYIRQKNQWLQKLDRDSRRHMNCFRFGENETIEHIQAKLDVILLERECEFITEVYSADRKFRADVLIFNHLNTLCYAKIIEIAKHETKESIEKKRAFWSGKHGFDFQVL